MTESLPHLAPFKLLGAPPGKCPECAVDHAPDQPHNAQSLCYQYRFYGQHGRWPTWADAIAHCAPEVRAAWEAELRKRGCWTESTAESFVLGKEYYFDVTEAPEANA